jgi:predicted MFS family arabinose efflux permease
VTDVRAALAGKTYWPAVAALMAAGIVAAAQIGKSAAALPVLRAEFALSLSAAAWFISMISLVGAIAGATLGWLGQSIGFRRQVLAGLTLILLMNVAGTTAQAATALLVTRVGESLGFALVVLAAPSLLTTVAAPADRRLAVGAWGAYMPIGAGFGTLLVALVTPFAGWRGVWWIAAAATLAAVVAVGWTVPGAPRSDRPQFKVLGDAIRTPGLMCLAAVFMVYSGQYLAVLGLLPTMLVSEGSMSVATAGVISSLAFVANAPGNVLGAVLQHRGVPRYRLLIGGSACMGASVWVLHFGDMPIAVRVAATVAFSFTAGVVPSAAFGGAAALTAGTPVVGAAMGVLLQASSVGQLLVPPLVASATVSWMVAPAVLSVLAALAIVGGVIYRRLDGHDAR